jgi:hypothetical protein
MHASWRIASLMLQLQPLLGRKRLWRRIRDVQIAHLALCKSAHPTALTHILELIDHAVNIHPVRATVLPVTLNDLAVYDMLDILNDIFLNISSVPSADTLLPANPSLADDLDRPSACERGQSTDEGTAAVVSLPVLRETC